MSDRPRRARPRAASRLVVATGATLAALLALGACAFPGDRDEGPAVEPSRAPAASAPPAGVSDPAREPALAKFYGQALRWSECEDGNQCADLTVPLDWASPGGETITVALLKQPAGGDQRLGSLVVNPGGPGVSGKAYAAAARQAFGRSITDHYDVVGFDPRGVGDSRPAVECLPNAELDEYVAEDGSPDDAAELSTAIAEMRRFSAACEANTGPLLRHVDTLSVAKDMDVLREALGDDRLTYHGASYGTYIGAWYAETFPWRVGRMVFDGAIDPSMSAEQYVGGQAEGFSRALNAYVSDCQSQSECPLRGNLDEGKQQLGQVVEDADERPLKTDAGRPLTQALMVTGIAQGLYDDQLWPALSVGIQNALAGDGSGLLRLADVYLERDEAGDFGQSIAANPAIFCLDVAEQRTPEEIRSDADEMERRFPPLGGAIAWGAVGCAEWPIDAVMKRQRITAEGAAPILVLGTVDDPATPYEWAEALAGQLSSGRLLTWEGSVHTAYQQGSECVDDAVETYMLTGETPANGKRCT